MDRKEREREREGGSGKFLVFIGVDDITVWGRSGVSPEGLLRGFSPLESVMTPALEKCFRLSYDVAVVHERCTRNTYILFSSALYVRCINEKSRMSTRKKNTHIHTKWSEEEEEFWLNKQTHAARISTFPPPYFFLLSYLSRLVDVLRFFKRTRVKQKAGSFCVGCERARGPGLMLRVRTNGYNCAI